MFKLVHLIVFAALSLVSLSNSRHLPELVDLCHSYDNKTVFSYPRPGENEIRAFSTYFLWKGTVPSGTWYQAKEFCAKEHGGTHIDAPSHFSEPSWNVDQIPIERLVSVPAVIIDIREKASRVLDATVDVSDLVDWESKHGPIEEGSVVIMHSGWAKYYGNFTAYSGTLDGMDPSEYHFPGFSLAAGKWLAKKGVYGLGVDTPSIDPGNSKKYEVHVELSPQNIYLLENIAHLDKLTPPSGWKLHILPIKLKDGTGGPTRIVAVRERGVLENEAQAIVVQPSEAQQSEVQQDVAQPNVAQPSGVQPNVEAQQHAAQVNEAPQANEEPTTQAA